MRSKIPLLAIMLLLLVPLMAYGSAQPMQRTLDKMLGYNFGPMRSIFPPVQHPYNHLQDFKDLGGSFARIVFYPSIDLVPNLATPEDPNDFIEDELSGIGFYETKFPEGSDLEITMRDSSDWRLTHYHGVLDQIRNEGLKPIAIITPQTDAIILTGPHFKFNDVRIIVGGGTYNEQAWKDYVRAVINEYKDDVKFWEVENEPDLPSGYPGGDIDYFNTDYRTILKIAYDTIKEECSDCIVINGGLVSFDAYESTEIGFFGWLQDNDVPTDALSLHRGGSLSEYPNPFKPENMHSIFYNNKRMDVSIEESFNSFISRAIPEESKNKVWLTEMPGMYATQAPPAGYPENSWGHVSEETQADYIARGILLAFSRPEVEVVSLQWIINDLDFTVLGTSDSLTFHSGIIKTDGTFKSAYYALQRLVNEVGDFELVECAAGQTLCASGNNFVMKFKKGTEAKWVAWNSEGSSTVSINTGISNQEVGSFNIVTGISVNEFSNNITIDETPRVITLVSTSTPSFKFAVLADSRGDSLGSPAPCPVNTATLSIIKDNIILQNPELVFFPGDLICTPSSETQQQEYLSNWVGVMNPLISKTFAQVGNHELCSPSCTEMQGWKNSFDFGATANGIPEIENFQEMPGFEDFVFAFEFENALFVSLSSNFPVNGTINEAQRTWLASVLLASTAQHKFVFFHNPPYPLTHSPINERNELMQVLFNGGVDAVFVGHDHLYASSFIESGSSGLWQIITGGAGAPLYDCPNPLPLGVENCESTYNFVIVEVDGSTATLKAFRQDASIIETINLLAPPVTPGVEICSNGLNDDSDALIDCLDSDCFGNSYCRYQSGCTAIPCVCLSGYNNCNESGVDGCETAGSCLVIPPSSGLKVESVVLDKQSYLNTEPVTATAIVSGSGIVSSVEFQLINFNGEVVSAQDGTGSFPNYSSTFNLSSLQNLVSGSFKVKVIVNEGMPGEVVGFSDYFFINFAGQPIAVPEIPVLLVPLVALIALLLLAFKTKRQASFK